MVDSWPADRKESKVVVETQRVIGRVEDVSVEDMMVEVWSEFSGDVIVVFVGKVDDWNVVDG